MDVKKDYYAILDISPTAPDEEIRLEEIAGNPFPDLLQRDDLLLDSRRMFSPRRRLNHGECHGP